MTEKRGQGKSDLFWVTRNLSLLSLSWQGSTVYVWNRITIDQHKDEADFKSFYSHMLSKLITEIIMAWCVQKKILLSMF